MPLIDSPFERLKLSCKKMERKLRDKTDDLMRSKHALKVEIVERKRVEKEILDITQKEQRRFSSQLHDGLCQELTGILIFAKGLTQKMEKDNRLDVAELNKISDLLYGTVSQAREMARGLYPGELLGASLMNTLEELASRTQKLSAISCQFYCPKRILINENDVATHLYKIAQEGVSNAVEHGKAKAIKVSLIQKNGNIILAIKDDGVGLMGDSPKSKGIGLQIMKYRAHIMDASFQMQPNTPHGVILKVIIKQLKKKVSYENKDIDC